MKKGITYGEYLFGKKEHKRQMRRVRQSEKEAKIISYEISEDGKSIKCTCCGMTSYNPIDVREKYCGNCKAYHFEYEEQNNAGNREPKIPRKT